MLCSPTSSSPRGAGPQSVMGRKTHQQACVNGCTGSTLGCSTSPRSTAYDVGIGHPDSSAHQDDVLLVLRCHGFDRSATNEVLYLAQQHADTRGNVVLFPGDVQDLHHRMVAAGHGEWSEYSVERTARVVANKFPGHAVWVVLPKAHVHGALASYDNFAGTDWESGGAVPEYDADGGASLNLEALLEAAAAAVVSEGTGSRASPDLTLPLTLVGFSKGAVVLNQLVTELARDTARRPSRQSKNSSSSWGNNSTSNCNCNINGSHGGGSGGRSGPNVISGSGCSHGARVSRKRPRVTTPGRGIGGGGGGGGGGVGCVGGVHVGGGGSGGGGSGGGSGSSGGGDGSGGGGGGGDRGGRGVSTPTRPAGKGVCSNGSLVRGEDREGKEHDGETRPMEGEGSGIIQDNAGSLWSRLLSFSMSRFSASTLSSASLGSTTDESQASEGTDEEDREETEKGRRCLNDDDNDNNNGNNHNHNRNDNNNGNNHNHNRNHNMDNHNHNHNNVDNDNNGVGHAGQGQNLGPSARSSPFASSSSSTAPGFEPARATRRAAAPVSSTEFSPFAAARRNRRRNRPTSCASPAEEETEAVAAATAAATTSARPRRRGEARYTRSGRSDARDRGAPRRLFDRVAAIHWVDGGNGGLEGSFPTNPACLAALAALPGLAVRVHGTPYQWANPCRPWLAFEADSFLASLEGFQYALVAKEEGFRHVLEAQGEGCDFLSSTVGGGGGGLVGSHGEDGGFVLEAASRGEDSRLEDVVCGVFGGLGCVSSGGLALGSAKGRLLRAAAPGVKRLRYFGDEEPSLDMHFKVLGKINTG